jgi:uncharacterized repeat protein (TIGR03803 family)
MNSQHFNAKAFSFAALAFLALAPATVFSQTLKTLHDMTHIDGAYSSAQLTQGFDGNLYGTAYLGGEFFTDCEEFHTAGCGTIFRITPSGQFTLVYSFDGFDGADPIAGVTLGPDGNFYGVTSAGGPSFATDGGLGTVFKITPTGQLTTLYNFEGFADGYAPQGPLLFASDGNLYGTTVNAGQKANLCHGCGTIFRISPTTGEFTVLHNFNGYPDGGLPEAGLIEGPNGNLYGTASAFGNLTNQAGTVFTITPEGKYTVLHDFTRADGFDPIANLVLGSDGDFYGTTALGGAIGYGTVFKMTPAGKLTTLHNFSANADLPTGTMVQAQDGNFYGTTQSSQTIFSGAMFKITPDGAFTSLATLPGNHYWGGDELYGGLWQGTNGEFYGISAQGGPISAFDCPHEGCGLIFSLSVGLGPFIGTVPMAATVGTAVQVLGSDLTGASSVTFNGTPAEFTVVSPTQISTRVPSGAESGRVAVKLPNGTLRTIAIFRVKD